MNAIDRFFLRLFLLPQRLYAAQGVNILHLRAILTAKLTMGQPTGTIRHGPTSTANQKTIPAAGRSQ